jgi:hypothetical protein
MLEVFPVPEESQTNLEEGGCENQVLKVIMFYI